MHRRYTIHRDGDILVEELDEQGQPISPEPVPPEDRLPEAPRPTRRCST